MPGEPWLFTERLLCSLRTAAKQHTSAWAEVGHNDGQDLNLNYSLVKCCLYYHVKLERMTAFACLKTAELYKLRATNIFPIRTVTLVVNVPGPLAVTVLNPTHPLPPKLSDHDPLDRWSLSCAACVMFWLTWATYPHRWHWILAARSAPWHAFLV